MPSLPVVNLCVLFIFVMCKDDPSVLGMLFVLENIVEFSARLVYLVKAKPTNSTYIVMFIQRSYTILL